MAHLDDGLSVFGNGPPRSFDFRLRKQDNVNWINFYLILRVVPQYWKIFENIQVNRTHFYFPVNISKPPRYLKTHSLSHGFRLLLLFKSNRIKIVPWSLIAASIFFCLDLYLNTLNVIVNNITKTQIIIYRSILKI